MELIYSSLFKLFRQQHENLMISKNSFSFYIMNCMFVKIFNQKIKQKCKRKRKRSKSPKSSKRLKR